MLECGGGASAEEKINRKVRIGFLDSPSVSSEEFSNIIDEANRPDFWNYYNISDPQYAPYTTLAIELVPFDSLVDMIMALDAGKIDTIEMLDCMGKYFFKQGNNADKYITYQYLTGLDSYLSMGFAKGNKWFEPFNSAIKAAKQDGTLQLLKAKYLIDIEENEPQPVKFESFPDAETVKIAVTGDCPPIDYVAADGSPAGYNTELLAYIGRRLKVNIKIVSINTGARAAALSSGRADGVFWFWSNNSEDGSYDTPEGVVLTEPYYRYDTCVYIGRKLHE